MQKRTLAAAGLVTVTALGRVLLSATFIALAMIGPSKAETNGKPETAYPSRAVLKEIIIWLSANFDLPQILILPNIEIVSRAEISALRYKGFAWVAPRDIVAQSQDRPPSSLEVIAVYDDEMKTIYLPEGWIGATPLERSVLVHQMVHHLQNLGKVKYECPAAREQLAYIAQDRWLGLSGLNLAEEFEIDPFTLVVSTRCIY